MKQVAYALVLVTGLGGCQSIDNAFNTSVPNVVTPQHVYQAHLAYDSVAVLFARYRARPLCLKGQNQFTDGCGLRSVDVQIQDINRRARVALNELDVFEATHRGQASFQGVQLLTTASDLIASAKRVVAANRLQ